MSARRFEYLFALPVACAAMVGSANAQPVLSIVTDDALQQIEVEVGPIAGEVRVYGVTGIPSGQLFESVTAIDLTTGNAQDNVEFRIFSEVVPTITLNTGGDNSDVKIIYFAPATLGTVASVVNVSGGGGNDKVNFLVESLAAGFDANWTVDSAGGENDVNASVFSPEAADLVQVALTANSGDGKDKVTVSMLTDAATASLSLVGNMAGGEDSAGVTNEQLGLGSIVSAFSLNLGADKDTAEVKILSPGGATSHSGSILGEGGIDTLTFSAEADGTFDVTLDGGDDADSLDFFAKGLVGGSPTLLGGGGDDFLKMVIDGLPGATSLADGGPGFDVFTGFAATIVNCELIN